MLAYRERLKQGANNMNWWANDPIVFVREGDLECNRIRLLIAEKRCSVAVRVIEYSELEPEFLTNLNPDGVYPLLVCKELACYGYALEEFLHERYPERSLLPTNLVRRAQLRVLTQQVRSWYRLPPIKQRAKFYELAGAFNPHLPFFASQDISVLDIAIAALLFDAPRIQYQLVPGDPFTGYVRMLVGRPSFDVLPRPPLPYRTSQHVRLGAA